MSDIFHLFGRGNLTFIREKSGKSQGILKTDVCGNYLIDQMLKVVWRLLKRFHHWANTQKGCTCTVCTPPQPQLLEYKFMPYIPKK